MYGSSNGQAFWRAAADDPGEAAPDPGAVGRHAPSPGRGSDPQRPGQDRGRAAPRLSGRADRLSAGTAGLLRGTAVFIGISAQNLKIPSIDSPRDLRYNIFTGRRNASPAAFPFTKEEAYVIDGKPAGPHPDPTGRYLGPAGCDVRVRSPGDLFRAEVPLGRQNIRLGHRADPCHGHGQYRHSPHPERAVRRHRLGRHRPHGHPTAAAPVQPEEDLA